MLCALGDLLDDVVVWLAAPIVEATDTPARIFHRRGGSAANVASFAARAGHSARFVGQVGDDGPGRRLVADLRDDGVDVRVRCSGRTGTVVVVVAPGGERTMLTDRGSATELADPPLDWLDGVTALHVTGYSLVVEPVGTAAAYLVAAAKARGALVSVDASSVRALEDYGADEFLALLARLRPDVLLANGEEAGVLAVERNVPDGVGMVVVKRGAGSTSVIRPDAPVLEVAAPTVAGVADTTGAGDAFAAGFVCALVDGGSAADAVAAGHALAAAVLAQPGASLPVEVAT